MKFRVWFSAKRQRHILDIEAYDEDIAAEIARFMMWDEVQGTARVRLLKIETEPPDWQEGHRIAPN